MWGDHYNLTFDATASFSYLISPLTTSRHLALASKKAAPLALRVENCNALPMARTRTGSGNPWAYCILVRPNPRTKALQRQSYR
jgi:hypothetical protein